MGGGVVCCGLWCHTQGQGHTKVLAKVKVKIKAMTKVTPRSMLYPRYANSQSKVKIKVTTQQDTPHHLPHYTKCSDFSYFSEFSTGFWYGIVSNSSCMELSFVYTRWLFHVLRKTSHQSEFFTPWYLSTVKKKFKLSLDFSKILFNGYDIDKFCHTVTCASSQNFRNLCKFINITAIRELFLKKVKILCSLSLFVATNTINFR